MENKPVLRPIGAGDLEGYLQLIHAVGWSRSTDPSSGDWAYNERQFKLFLTIGKLFGHQHEGRLISCAGLFPFGAELASVGMVMVHPNYQRRGLGNQLMKHCLELSNGVPLVLVATEMGEPVYKSVGFHTVEKIRRFVLEGAVEESNESTELVSRNAISSTPNQKTPHLMQRSASNVTTPNVTALNSTAQNVTTSQTGHASETHLLTSRVVAPITSHDLPEIIEVDQRVIGADRALFYHTQFAYTDMGFLIRDSASGRIEAFALGLERKDLQALALGPFYATTTDAALQVLHHLQLHWQGSLRINVPEHQKEFIAALQKIGYNEVNVSPLMIRGIASLPGDRSQLYGIADPALG